MNILLLGSGGREHALAWKIAASPLVTKLWCAPGNAGIAREAECVALDIADHAAVIDFCRRNAVDFVVVGPDDAARGRHRRRSRRPPASRRSGRASGGAARRLEEFHQGAVPRINIPTGAYGRFTDAAAALAYVREQGAPIVVKADGLAAGKGVVVAKTLREAEAAIAMMFDGAFGAAGAEVVIEEFLEAARSASSRCATARPRSPLATAQDHKRVLDRDEGRTPAAWAPIHRRRS